MSCQFAPDDDRWSAAPFSEAFMAWRRELVSIERLESEPIFDLPPLRADSVGWQKLKKQVLPGDEIWTFDSPDRFWRQGMGHQGIVLVRSGAYVDSYTVAMN